MRAPEFRRRPDMYATLPHREGLCQHGPRITSHRERFPKSELRSSLSGAVWSGLSRPVTHRDSTASPQQQRLVSVAAVRPISGGDASTYPDNCIRNLSAPSSCTKIPTSLPQTHLGGSGARRLLKKSPTVLAICLVNGENW